MPEFRGVVRRLTMNGVGLSMKGWLFIATVRCPSTWLRTILRRGSGRTDWVLGVVRRVRPRVRLPFRHITIIERPGNGDGEDEVNFESGRACVYT